jgi:hypothetical protein
MGRIVAPPQARPGSEDQAGGGRRGHLSAYALGTSVVGVDLLAKIERDLEVCLGKGWLKR